MKSGKKALFQADDIFSPIGLLRYLGQIAILFSHTVVAIVSPPYRFRQVFFQVVRIGINSLLICSVVALFVGMIMTIQTAYQMQRVSAEMYIASLVSLSLLRELGPVLTALIVSGRAGGAVTAELGTMKVTEQIDALISMGVGPVEFLVVPRFLAFVLSLPVLVAAANLIGIVGGGFVCWYNLGIPIELYFSKAFAAISVKDVIVTVIKSIVFAMIIATVSSLEGLEAKGGAEGVGEATMRSVVSCFIWIIFADWILSTLFYFIF